METFTVTIERNAEQAQLLRDTAAFFSMALKFQPFLLYRRLSDASRECGNKEFGDTFLHHI